MIIEKPVFTDNYSTKMLFRCIEKKYANDFLKGKIRFSQPKNWIEAEINGNKGLGDSLEGVFFSTHKDDPSTLVTKLKSNPNINHFEYNNNIYFRRNEIENLFCLCFYGVNENKFNEKITDLYGKTHDMLIVNQDYFKDFSKKITKEQYLEMEESEKPVVLFIMNARKIIEKIQTFFENMGVEKNDIIIRPVEYMDKNVNMISFLPYPNEIFLKDNYYNNQSELRIVINSKNARFINYMKTHNNIIDIGDIQDFVKLHDFYFEDLKIIKDSPNSIVYNLSFPQDRCINDMNLSELLDIYAAIHTNQKYREIMCRKINIKEFNDDLVKLIEDKYKLIVAFNQDHGFIFTHLDDTYTHEVNEWIKLNSK